MTKFRETASYTQIQMEAALCAWEWMCENREHDLLKPFFESLGSSAMRMVSVQAGNIAAQVHDHMDEQGYEFADAYDWEFVPGVLLRLDWTELTEDNQYSGKPYQPDLHAIFVAMVAADKSGQTNPAHRSFQKRDKAPEEDWITRARAEAEKQWGYGDLVSDHPERVTSAMEEDEDIPTFIKWLGEKYDLIPRSDMAFA